MHLAGVVLPSFGRSNAVVVKFAMLTNNQDAFCGSGFVRGIITKGASRVSGTYFSGENMVVERTVMASFAGGLSAHATGDDFVQGAFYSAIAHLSNHETTKLIQSKLTHHPIPNGDGVTKKGLGGTRTADGRFSLEGKFRRNSDGSPRAHKGIDIIADIGTNVRASGSGKVSVVCSGRCGGYGNVIYIDHGDNNVQTRYSHLSSIFVLQGSYVSGGDSIGLSGNSQVPPNAAPHLHFEIRYSGIPHNPARYFSFD